jgi:UDP-N-acetyl-D-mannosaminuronic acid dehydrogenase
MTKVSIIGGCGHVGLPLSIAFAESDFEVVAYDISEQSVNLVNQGIVPFIERGAKEALNSILKKNKVNLLATNDKKDLANSDLVIIVIGTDIDKHGNPRPMDILEVLSELLEIFSGNQIVMLRSTIIPGVTDKVKDFLNDNGLSPIVVYCPERIAEGNALNELKTLPQIIGAYSKADFLETEKYFSRLGVECIRITPIEAEFAKLFSNAWRYIKFATVNEFWMIANDFNVNFSTVLSAIKYKYPRAADMPVPGFAAGPCLPKDTIQINALSPFGISLGQSAVKINEGLPIYICEQLKKLYNLKELTVGILGMAFKSESDDIRSSLSYKLKRQLEFYSKKVITTDPYVTSDPELLPLKRVISESDIVIIATPHTEYRQIKSQKIVFDIWEVNSGRLGETNEN